MTFRMARVFMGAVAAMLIVLPATLRAQDATGKIAGTVFDATGAVSCRGEGDGNQHRNADCPSGCHSRGRHLRGGAASDRPAIRWPPNRRASRGRWSQARIRSKSTRRCAST